jgi:sulfur transfer protein SufE
MPLAAALRQAQGWDNVMRHLMLAGKRLAVVDEAERTPTRRVHGCQSGVWISCSVEDGQLAILAYSDSKILRGVLAIIQERYKGLSIDQARVLNIADHLQALKLDTFLTQSRANGIHHVIQYLTDQLATIAH